MIDLGLNFESPFDSDLFFAGKEARRRFDLQQSFDRLAKSMEGLPREGGSYVVETSSNLNENPKVEQFCMVNDGELLQWYRETLRRCVDAL